MRLIWMWLALTSAHVALSARWARRAADAVPSTDEIFFVAMLAGTGSLSLALHAALTRGGITLPRVAVALAVWHVACWSIARRRPAIPRDPSPGPIEAAAAVVLVGI